MQVGHLEYTYMGGRIIYTMILFLFQKYIDEKCKNYDI